MLKIIDVDYIEDFKLALAFNDGFEGIVDLTELFSNPPFEQLAEQFLNFSLTEGTLCWQGDMHVSPDYLRDIAIAQPTDNIYIDPNNPLDVITQAFRDSLTEDDPTILQAALRGYADKLGMSNLVQNAGIKSRTSAYKSLSQQGSPKWETIVKLAHSVISLENQSVHCA
jgi:probable addiction module antidote protein